MKNFFIAMLCVILFYTSTISLNAQNSNNSKDSIFLPKYSIKFAPVNFAWGNFQIAGEKFFKTRNSLELIGNVMSLDDVTGASMELQYRFDVIKSFKSDNFTIFYFAPYALGGSYDLETYSGGGVLMGINYIISKKICMDFYCGGGIKYSSDYNNSDIFSYSHNGVSAKAGFQIGIVF